jgi:AraC family transcriptional regulator
VHPAHLSRTFRRHYRRSVGEYARELRLDRSVPELCDPERSLAEVAAGFYDQSHFANPFKRHTGMIPAQFRHEHARSPRTKRRSTATRRWGGRG